MSLHISQPSQDVVEVGDNHQQDEYSEADILSDDEESLAGFAPGDHLVE